MNECNHVFPSDEACLRCNKTHRQAVDDCEIEVSSDPDNGYLHFQLMGEHIGDGIAWAGFWVGVGLAIIGGLKLI